MSLVEYLKTSSINDIKKKKKINPWWDEMKDQVAAGQLETSS